MGLNLRIRTAAARNLGVDMHVCEVQLLLRNFAELKVSTTELEQYSIRKNEYFVLEITLHAATLLGVTYLFGIVNRPSCWIYIHSVCHVIFKLLLLFWKRQDGRCIDFKINFVCFLFFVFQFVFCFSIRIFEEPNRNGKMLKSYLIVHLDLTMCFLYMQLRCKLVLLQHSYFPMRNRHRFLSVFFCILWYHLPVPSK